MKRCPREDFANFDSDFLRWEKSFFLSSFAYRYFMSKSICFGKSQNTFFSIHSSRHVVGYPKKKKWYPDTTIFTLYFWLILFLFFWWGRGVRITLVVLTCVPYEFVLTCICICTTYACTFRSFKLGRSVEESFEKQRLMHVTRGYNDRRPYE